MSKKKAVQLGDAVEKVTEITGIKSLVKYMAGEDCGCKERKEKLNEWGVALSLYLLVNIATLIAVSDSDTDQMAETLYGKIVLLHVRPTNLFFHLLG